MPDPFSSVIAVLLAAVIAFTVQFCELYFTKYPNTIELFIGKTWKIFGYSLMYGIAGAIMMLLVLFYLDGSVVTGENTPVNNVFLQACVVGITVKGLLEINCFSFKNGTTESPIGLKTLTQLFEPYFIGQLEMEEYNYTKEYVDQRISKYPDLVVIKQMIKNNSHVDSNKKDFTTFLIDLDEIGTTPSEALLFYLERFGRKNFDRVFPY